MKKGILGLVLLALLFVGCTEVEDTNGNDVNGNDEKQAQGDYRPGMYTGYYIQEEGRYAGVATAVVFVDEDGFIAHVYLDATYMKDDIPHSKKALGDDYNMRQTSANIGVIPGGAEWDEQAIAVEEKVVAEQGLEWVTFDDEGEVDVDAVSGATMIISELVYAVEEALEKAN